MPEYRILTIIYYFGSAFRLSETFRKYFSDNFKITVHNCNSTARSGIYFRLNFVCVTQGLVCVYGSVVVSVQVFEKFTLYPFDYLCQKSINRPAGVAR